MSMPATNQLGVSQAVPAGNAGLTSGNDVQFLRKPPEYSEILLAVEKVLRGVEHAVRSVQLLVLLISLCVAALLTALSLHGVVIALVTIGSGEIASRFATRYMVRKMDRDRPASAPGNV